MNEDEKVQIYNKGMREGMKHSTPSPETERRLDNIEKAIVDIPAKLVKIETKQDNLIDTTDAVLKQAKATNGRVTKLEMWKYAFMAIITVAVMVSGVIMTLTIQNLDYRISTAIDIALDNHEFEITE